MPTSRGEQELLACSSWSGEQLYVSTAAQDLSSKHSSSTHSSQQHDDGPAGWPCARDNVRPPAEHARRLAVIWRKHAAAVLAGCSPVRPGCRPASSRCLRPEASPRARLSVPPIARRPRRLSGFLGAGKTTLLRYLLENSKTKIACIVNDVASVNIDAKLVRNDKNRGQQAGGKGSEASSTKVGLFGAGGRSKASS